MPKYRVHFEKVTHYIAIIEADNERDANNKADVLDIESEAVASGEEITIADIDEVK